VFIRRLEINDFKAYASADIPLSPLTLILGPNGTGKTSVLQALELVSGLVDSTIKEVLARRDWDYTDLSHLKSKTKQFGFTLQFDGDDFDELTWSIKLGHKRGPGIASEVVFEDELRLLHRSWRDMTRTDQETGQSESITQMLTQSWLSAVSADDDNRFPGLLKIATWARSVAGYIELQPAELRTSARRTDEGIGNDGGKLAGFLGFLKAKHPDRFDAVIEQVRRVYPRLVSVGLKTARAGWIRLEVVEKWGSKQLAFNAQQVSDGLLRLLAISALAQAPDPPSLVMIDEIENGLHPHLLNALVEMLQQVADSGTQVIATTHSPIALNYVRDAEQVLIAGRHQKSGVASLTPLSRSVAYRRVASVMDPGEAWYNLGEDRLLSKLTPN
jgi:predicted ATPase